MAKQTVPQRVNEYRMKHPEVYDVTLTDVNEIRELRGTLEIVCTAYAYGYVKAQKSRKGGGRA